MILLDGKYLSELIKEELKKELLEITAKGNRKPHLSAILVGENSASITYVNNKIKSCDQIGFDHSLYKYEDSISEETLLNKINEINQNQDIDGLLVQLPLPLHISVDKVIETISQDKDVDGFHPVNIGKMVKNIPSFIPATPKGILELIKHYKIETSGKNCVVIGRSQIVGTPMSILMGRKDYPGDATVTLVHSHTKNMKEICLKADIIIAAIGHPYYITADMVKEDAVVIDVGMNSIPDATKKSGSRLVGDVDFPNVSLKCSYITPVPGGVGLLTIAALMQNTMISYKKRVKVP